MRKSRVGWVMLLLLLLAAPGGWAAAPLRVDLDLGFDSNYVFRGSKRGPFGLNGTLTLSKEVAKGLTVQASAWNYLPLDGQFNFGEGKYAVGFSYRPPLVGRLAAIEGGYSYFDITNRLTPTISFGGDNTFGRDTQEAYLRLALDLPGRPSIDLLQDFQNRVGTYFRVSAAKDVDLKGPWALGLSGSFGLDFGRGVDTFRDFAWRTELRYELGQGIGLMAGLDWWLPSHQVDAGAGGLRLVPSFGINLVPRY
ncbi:MAG: hypothetical protein IT204_12780 [Fimbriimonadaceae bacterium]|nr:hypothetical protein [Fimbriimonadaceae bacterium]